MIPNVNPETGIAYGVVALLSLEDWVFEEFESHGMNLTERAVAREALEEHPEWEGTLPFDFWDDVQLEECEYELNVPEKGLSLGLSWLGGAPLVWVFESPYTTRARPCSPCVPGAGDLNNKDESGVLCYDLPPDWYRKEE